MIIKSKKTGLEHTIDKEEWDKMVESKDSIHFTVIDKEKSILSKTTPIPIPEVQEYQKKKTQTKKQA